MVLVASGWLLEIGERISEASKYKFIFLLLGNIFFDFVFVQEIFVVHCFFIRGEYGNELNIFFLVILFHYTVVSIKWKGF